MGQGKSVGWLEAYLGLDTTQFYQGIGRAQASMKAAGASMKRIGSSLSMSLTAPLLIAGGASVQLARNFEKSFSKIEGLVGIARSEVQAMRGDVLSLAGQTGRAPQELADALFFVTSAGLRGKDAMDVLKMSARASAAGLGDTADVADLLTSAVNAYGPAALNAATATDIITAAVREGKAEAAALASSMGDVLPIASNMGVSFDQVGAAIASMTRTGTSAETSVTQLRQILASILKPSQQAEEALEGMGTSSAELRKQLREEGLIDVLGFLAEQMKTNEQAMAEVFPNIRALSGALDIMGSNAEENIGIFKRMESTVGIADQAFNAAANTADMKFNKALAELKVSAIDMGTTLLPLVTNFLDAVRSGLRAFQNLTEEGRNMVLILGGIAMGLGPVISLLGTLAIILGSITAPMVAVAAIVAIVAAEFLWLYANWDAFVERLSRMGTVWKNVLISMIQFLIMNNPFKWIVDMYNKAVSLFGMDQIQNPFLTMALSLEELKTETKEYEHQFTSFLDGVGEGADKLKKKLSDALFPKKTNNAETVLPTAEGGKAAASGLAKVSKAAEEATDSVEELSDMGMQLNQVLTGALTDGFVSLGETIGNLFSDTSNPTTFFQKILTVLATFLSGLGRALIAAGVASEAFKKLFANPYAAIAAGTAAIVAATIVKNKLQSTAQGLRAGGFVTEGGMFQLHRDELVNLPAGSAVTSQRASRQMMGGANGSGNGNATVKLAMRKLIIETMKEEKRMNR
jgi:TP901 family phage tail tape measure protein